MQKMCMVAVVARFLIQRNTSLSQPISGRRCGDMPTLVFHLAFSDFRLVLSVGPIEIA
jgi:hypothetical protein